jgi:hypothetical protein
MLLKDLRKNQQEKFKSRRWKETIIIRAEINKTEIKRTV